MNKESDFPFEKARRVTPEENEKFRQAISQQFNLQLRQRDSKLKDENENYEEIYIKLDRKIVTWAKEKAKKEGIAYETVINETLLQQIL